MLVTKPKANKATDAIQFMESLVLSQGPLAGTNLKLLDWQQDFITKAFAPRVSTAALSVPRGNGKTTLIAAIGATAFQGPLAIPGAEIIIVASSFTQAKIAFDHIYYFLEPWIGDRGKFSKVSDWRVVNNNSSAEIVHMPTRKKIKVIGSDPKRAHGLAPTMVICDEPAQWPPGQAEAMVSALTTSLGKQADNLMIALGTRPADPDHWFQKWLDGDADVGICYSASQDEDFMTPLAFMNANPSAIHMPSLVATGLKELERAQSSEEYLASYKALRLNLGTRDTKEIYVVSPEDWAKCEVGSRFELPPADGPCIWGVDLGGGAAMSAVAAYWPITGRLETAAAFPDDISLEARGKRDQVGGRYLDMQARGELFTTPGRVVKPVELVAYAYARFGRPTIVCADRWKEKELLDALDDAGIPGGGFSPRGEGWVDGSEDIRYFIIAVQTGKVKTAESLLMRSAIAGACLVQDPAGNRKLARHGDGTTRKALHRDDALAATIKAVSEAMRNKSLQTANSMLPLVISVAAVH